MPNTTPVNKMKALNGFAFQAGKAEPPSGRPGTSCKPQQSVKCSKAIFSVSNLNLS
jgi:hypothetical protein